MINDKSGKNTDQLLKDALKDIEKLYGQGSIMRLGDKSNIRVKVVSTGSLLLNQALGVDGYPTGRIIEIFGPESSGKTTIALHAIAECQKAGGRAAFIDAEHAIDPEYARKLGVKIDDLILSQPSSGEEGLEIADVLVKSGAIDMIVIDSVPALVPKTELEGEMIEAQMGLQARMMSKALRKLTGNISKNDCIIIFINQLREKLGNSYGNPETTPGGRALKFYSTIRIDVRKGEPIKIGTEMVGNEVKLKVVKNKVSAPFKSCTVELIFGQGISFEGEMLSIATQFDIIKKSGSWFEYKGEKLGQGKDNVRLLLKENKELREEILGILNSKYAIK